MRLLDSLMWLMFLLSLVVSLLTMIVVFGIRWISPFATFLPLEVSLAATFFVWGLNSIYNNYTRDSKLTMFYSFVLGGILLVFVVLGIY